MEIETLIKKIKKLIEENDDSIIWNDSHCDCLSYEQGKEDAYNEILTILKGD